MFFIEIMQKVCRLGIHVAWYIEKLLLLVKILVCHATGNMAATEAIWKRRGVGRRLEMEAVGSVGSVGVRIVRNEREVYRGCWVCRCHCRCHRCLVVSLRLDYSGLDVFRRVVIVDPWFFSYLDRTGLSMKEGVVEGEYSQWLGPMHEGPLDSSGHIDCQKSGCTPQSVWLPQRTCA